MSQYHNPNCNGGEFTSWVDLIYSVAMAGFIVTPAMRVYFGVSEWVYVVLMLALSSTRVRQ